MRGHPKVFSVYVSPRGNHHYPSIMLRESCDTEKLVGGETGTKILEQRNTHTSRFP